MGTPPLVVFGLDELSDAILLRLRNRVVRVRHRRKQAKLTLCLVIALRGDEEHHVRKRLGTHVASLGVILRSAPPK